MRFSVKELTLSAMVAAIYAALTLVLSPISFGTVQFRISEVLCALPFFYPKSIWGLFIGCIISNILGGMGILDIVFGSLATLLAAVCTSKAKKRIIAVLPPVVFNAFVVGAVLAYELGKENFWRSFALNAFWVGLGEAVVMFGVALPLLYILPKTSFLNVLPENKKY